MALTPDDIQNKSFTVRMRGYDQEQVNQYLDTVVREVNRLLKQNEDLESQLSAVNEKLTEYQGKHNSINNSIIVAQDAADRVKDEADTEADQVLTSARNEAESILGEAENNADELLKISVEKARRIERETEELRKHTNVFRKKLQVMIENQLDTVLNERWDEILNPSSINQSDLTETIEAEQKLVDKGKVLETGEEEIAGNEKVEENNDDFGSTPAVEVSENPIEESIQ